METSEYLCERFGWDHGLIQDYKAKKPFDLVVCYDVVQYLDSATAKRALANLSRLCRGMLYFTALTKKDWEENCDQSRTDSGRLPAHRRVVSQGAAALLSAISVRASGSAVGSRSQSGTSSPVHSPAQARTRSARIT